MGILEVEELQKRVKNYFLTIWVFNSNVQLNYFAAQHHCPI